MASVYPQSMQWIEPSATEMARSRSNGTAPGDDRRALERSLQSVLDNVECLHLYARSIVRMLETCEVEASQSRLRSRRFASAHPRRPSLDLDFVREDVDRLAGEVQVQLALLHAGILCVGREP